MGADAAMYVAKGAGRNRFKVYDVQLSIRSRQQLALENDLRLAIDRGALELHYQPKVDLTTLRIVGAEALLRWHDAQRGWISPADFIPVAEQSGLIVRLGDWVLRSACQQLAEWARGPLAGLHVAVNVSGRQFQQADFLPNLLALAGETGINVQRLQIEITESILIEDYSASLALLQSLHEAGIALCVDDFGTGYSSLSYLKRFPIDTIKIDRAFVRDLHIDRDNATICAAILAMAHQLRNRVVAEGVETEEQVTFLTQHSCDMAQGYYFGRPMPAADFVASFCGESAAEAQRERA
jgi:EAL domain-containing protein (putative c-di-GMP-specific phosphodiesterase class I)